MEHFKEGQYDDDLTQGSYDDDLTADINEYDDDFDTGDIDLFGFTDDEDSVLGRLKSIILSIEWEITDDILRQFNEELVELKNIWVGNKINLIYVQALEKLSRYIYKEKSSAHPHAIKLLLTFYSNLERIVSDESLSDQKKKKILRSDIELFEKLKKQISQSIPPKTADLPSENELSPQQVEVDEAPAPPAAEVEEIIDDSPEKTSKPGKEDPLLNLKAIVYGIDWEVTNHDLKNLSKEVKRLEAKFNDSKAKKIFLQGIGSLGSYINLKRSDAHADAFKLLHSFFVGLETVVQNNLSGQAEKDVLLPQVEKFNVFKSIIADTISPERLSQSPSVQEDADDEFEDGEIKPAFADVPDDVQGFQANVEEEREDVDEYLAAADEAEEKVAPDSALASEMESRLDGMFEEPSAEAVLELDKQKALQGVNVETEDDDDSEEEPLPVEDGELAPALAAEDSFSVEESPAVFTDKDDDVFTETELEKPILLGSEVPGVDVEHEADDDSDEEPLPFDGDEYAPALAGDGGEVPVEREQEGVEKEDIDNRLDDFFGESDDAEEEKAEITEVTEEDTAIAEPLRETNEIDGKISDFFGDTEPEAVTGEVQEAIKGVDVETEDDDDSEEEPLPLDGDEFAPALSDDEDVGDEVDAVVEGDTVEKELFADEKEASTEYETGSEEQKEDEDGDEESFLFDEGDDVVDLDLEEELFPKETEEPVLTDDDTEELEVDERFDELFGDQEEGDGEIALEPPPFDEEEQASREEIPLDDDQATEEDLSFEEEKDTLSTDAIEYGATDYEEAGFEEIGEEEIEEFPEETLAAGEDKQPVAEKALTHEEEILEYFKEEDQDEYDDQPIAAISGEDFHEEDIPEMEVDELATIIDDDSGVSAAGTVPSGYPSTDELLRQFGEVTGEEPGDTMHPEGDEDFIVGVEGPDLENHQEEEVIFQAVDETVESEEGAKEEFEDDDTFGITLLDDESYNSKIEEQEAEIQSDDLNEDEVLEEAVAMEVGAGSSAYVKPHGDAPLHESLGGMRNCIASLGLEIDTDILNSLNEEIDKLRHVWMDKPAEKTFIQLLSTIAGHINRYRYEADQDANRLLLSVFDKLELTALGQVDDTEIQEALLNETSKVLQWQARLIDRTPLTTETEETEALEKQFDQETTLLGETGTDEDFAIGLEDMSKKVDEIGNDMVMQKVSTIMKEELEQLKKDFQAELQELRKDILRGSDRE